MEGNTTTSITSPTLKKSLLRNYTIYTVSTLIQSSSYPQEFSVNRRFKDFEWLHNSLTLHCPGVLIPPLPKKEFFGRFDEDFIQSRIRGLEAFLHRILRHPLLNQQTYVRSFLQDHSMEVSYTNFKSIENQTNKRSESISSWFEAKIDNLKVSQQDIRFTSTVTAEFEANIDPIREYVTDTNDKIQRVNQATNEFIEYQNAYRHLLELRCASLNSLSAFDDMHDQPSHPTPLSLFAGNELITVNKLNESIQKMRIEVQEPINRLTQTFNELNRTIEIQKESHEDYLKKLSILNKKQAENKVKPFQEENVTISRQHYETITENLRKEYQIYRDESARELVLSIKNLANSQLSYHEQIGQELEILQKSIEKSVISSLSVQVTPSAPFYQQPEYSEYDPTVRTVTGQPIGRVVSRKYIDINENSAALLKENHYDDNHNEELIVGV